MKTFADGDPLFGVMMNAIASLWPAGTAVLSGCTQTGSGAARQVTVAAGSVMVNGTTRSVSQQTKTLDAAAFDRYDLISVNTSGTVVVTKGTEERRVPALPANSVPIAVCLIETGQTTLPADRIYDARLLASHVVAGQLTLAAGLISSGKTILNASGELAGGGVAGVLYPDPDLAAANICAQTLLEGSTLNDAWTQLLVLPAVPANLAVGPTHTVQVAWEHRSSYPGERVQSRVYVNGVAVGPIRDTSSTGYSVVSDPIDVSPGDVISIWGHGDSYSGVGVYVRNVKAHAVQALCARPAAW